MCKYLIFFLPLELQFRAFHLINCLAISNSLRSLSNCLAVASVSSRYRYYNWPYFSGPSSYIPPILSRALDIRLLSQFHPFSVQYSHPRFNHYSQSFVYSTSKIWNPDFSKFLRISHLKTPCVCICRILFRSFHNITNYGGNC